MSTDNVTLYLQAKTELDTASMEIERLRKLFTKVAEAFNSQKPPWISGVGVKRPPGNFYGSKLSFKANEWPDAQQLAEALAYMARAHNEANAYWGGLTASEKKNLIPPSLSTRDCNE